MADEDELLDIALSRLPRPASAFSDRGEDERTLREYPLHALTPLGSCRRILYTTKIDWLIKMLGSLDAIPPDVAVLWRYGPLGIRHTHIVASLMATLGAPLFFVGDLDPLDLATYGTLIRDLSEGDRPAIAATYLGIGDAWLECCTTDLASMVGKTLDVACIPLDDSERRGLDLLRQAPIDWRSLVGDQALSILESGRKLELEGASSPDFYSSALRIELSNLLFR